MSGIKRTLAFEVDLKSDLLRGVKRLRLRCVGFTPPVGETSADKVDSDSDDGSDSDRKLCCGFCGCVCGCVGVPDCPCGEIAGFVCEDCDVDGPTYPHWCRCGVCDGTKEGEGFNMEDYTVLQRRETKSSRDEFEADPEYFQKQGDTGDFCCPHKAWQENEDERCPACGDFDCQDHEYERCKNCE